MKKIIFNIKTNSLCFNERCIEISYRDGLVLEFLIKNKLKVVSKQDLISYAWSGGFVADSSLTKSISNLRNSLANLIPRDDFIVTIQRVGYKLISDNIDVVDEELTAPQPTGENINQPPVIKWRDIGVFHKQWAKAVINVISVGLLLTAVFPPFYFHGKHADVNFKIISNNKIGKGKTLIYQEGLESDSASGYTFALNLNCHCDVFIAKSKDLYTLSLYKADSADSINYVYPQDEAEDIYRKASAFLARK